MTADFEIEIVEQEDHRLGRQKVHDSRSKSYPVSRRIVDRSSWRDKAVRLYDPSPNPNQCHGECTGCAEAMVLNQVGNRVSGRTLNLLTHAHQIYGFASHNDPWPGGFPEQDTGSSGLAAAQASVHFGYASDYAWEFGGLNGVLQNVHEGRALSVGTWWYADMFGPSGGTFAGLPIFQPTGGQAGGHQYVVRGHDVDRKLVLCRTWWGRIRDFWLHESDLGNLLLDGGDAHFTRSI